MDTYTDIQQATTFEEIQACYPVMSQLRPQFTEERTFIEQVQRQFTQGFKLVCLKEDGHVRAVTGFLFMEFLAWGKVLYIADLVSDSGTRKSGYGGKLLKWVIEQAKKHNCDQVHLDSGPQRHDAHRLYLNHRFKITGHHFSLNLKESVVLPVNS